MLKYSDTEITVRFQKEGLHAYPAALEDPDLVEVNFLGHPHRHMFHFEVSISVEHNNREIEFILFKRWLESLYTSTESASSVLNHNYKSCEMIARELIETIAAKYPGRKYRVSVFEDGENGATVSATDIPKEEKHGANLFNWFGR